MGFKFDSHSLLFGMVKILLPECIQKNGPGIVDVVNEGVQGVLPLSDPFDPLVNFITFDICQCHGDFPHGGFESQYSYIDTDVCE